MPFTGTAEVVKSRCYKSRSTGQSYSLFTSWKPDDCDLIELGYTIRWGDGTVGTCKPAFPTEQKAQTYADNWNNRFAKELDHVT